jgi:hypothetical protein
MITEEGERRILAATAISTSVPAFRPSLLAEKKHTLSEKHT